MGYGKAVASYGPDGRPVAAFGTSVASIWWRTEAVYVRDGQQSVHVTLDEIGGALIYELETLADMRLEGNQLSVPVVEQPRSVASLCRTRDPAVARATTLSIVSFNRSISTAWPESEGDAGSQAL